MLQVGNKYESNRKIGRSAVEVRLGQKVKSSFTGREYKVKEKLQEGSILLQSEDGDAVAMVNEETLNCFFEGSED